MASVRNGFVTQGLAKPTFRGASNFVQVYLVGGCWRKRRMPTVIIVRVVLVHRLPFVRD